jgi:hypothetical protein
MSQVLSAEGSASETHILNSIILVVSITSALGAVWMIISFCVSSPSIRELQSYSHANTAQLFKAVRTFRHQLVL